MDEDEDEDDDLDGEDAETTAAQRTNRMAQLVPGLAADDWGQRGPAAPPQKPSPATSSKRDDTRFSRTTLDQIAQIAPSDSLSSSLPSVLPTIKPPPPARDAPKMRPPIFEKQQYDGVISDSESEEDEADLPPPGTLGRRIGQMKWSEGAPSGASIKVSQDEKKERLDDDEKRRRKLTFNLDDDEMERAVNGISTESAGPSGPRPHARKVRFFDEDEEMEEGDEDAEVDMGDEEAEFLKFARDALGVNEQMWADIITSREARGGQSISASRAGEVTDAPAFVPQSQKTKSQDREELSAKSASAGPRDPTDGPDQSLDTFDKVMAAMDSEYTRKVPAIAPAQKKQKDVSGSSLKLPPKGQSLPQLPTEADIDEMDEEELAAMDRELKEALKGAGMSDDEADDGELGTEDAKASDGDESREYRMMRDLMESYRSQGGQSGAVGNLFGRLGNGS